MDSAFFKKIYDHPLLTAADYGNLMAAHQLSNLQKGQLVLEKGRVANEYFLVETGLFRSYLHDYEGNEITTGFFGPNKILIESASLFQRIPSQQNLQALTDGTLWKIEFETFQGLYHSIPNFNEWGRAWMANQLFECQQRSVEMRTLSAKQRYLKLIEENPEVVKFAPLKYIASYLGITDSSLSRIRKDLSQL